MISSFSLVKRHSFIISASICWFFVLTSFVQATSTGNPPRKPNVIIILTDDQGYADVGFHNSSDIPTPNIDRIAISGVRFTQAYVTHPVCGPSRAAIITGRYQDRFGSSRNPLYAPKDSTMGLPFSEETIAEALSKADYNSSYMGKWHLGAHESNYPLNRGFDEFFGFLTGGHQYYPENWTLRDKSEARAQWDGYLTRIMQNNGRVNEEEYITDALSRKAVEFVDHQHSEKPFLLFLAYNAPHTPIQATDKYLSRFPTIKDTTRKIYATMMSAVDDGVGAILDKLEEKDFFENTIVIFLTDNGGAINDNGSKNFPLRGAKGSFFEGGIRVPFAMSWPDVLQAGVSFDKPISSMDIMATAVAEAGVSTKNTLDGVNLIPFLTGENQGLPHETLFWRNYDNGITVIRHGDLKLIEEPNKRLVFDIEANLSEHASSLITYNEKDHAHLMELLTDWKSELVPPRYLGLLQEAEYNSLHSDRFVMVNPYESDVLAVETPKDYELIWSQEFTTDGVLDKSVWNFEKGFVRNEELQWYQPENVVVQDGVLKFIARREVVQNPNYNPNSSDWRLNRKQANYTSASITTQDKFSFKYGILEVRARIDTSKGSWPAIWTLGIDRKWSDKGEIDVMEFYRRNNVPTIMANAAWIEDGKVKWDASPTPLSSLLKNMPDWPERFHVWKMVWDEDSIDIYLDDQLLNSITVVGASYSDGFNPFRQSHFILLNLALGSNGGNPDNTTFPLHYEVDYVRVFQKKVHN